MKTITALIVISLLGTMTPCPAAQAPGPEATKLEELTQHYPNARHYRLSQDEFLQVEPLLRERLNLAPVEIIQVAQLTTGQAGVSTPVNATPATNTVVTNVILTATNTILTTTNAAPTIHGHSQPAPSASATLPNVSRHAHDPEHSPDFGNLLVDLGRADFGSGDAAIVIFIVIGVAAVLAVVVYATVFLYEAVTGTGSRTHWWDVEAQSSFLTGGDRYGFLGGAQISSGLEQGNSRVGLIINGGYLTARVKPKNSTDLVDIAGGYAMAGAGVRWRLNDQVSNPSFFGLELLAGTATDEKVDVMSSTRATLSFGIGSRGRLGFSLGALYIGLDATDGLLDNADNFSTMIGVHSGVRF